LPMSSAATRATSSTASSVSPPTRSPRICGKKSGRRLPGELNRANNKAGLACSKHQCGALRPVPSVRHSDGLISAKAQPTSTGNQPPIFSPGRASRRDRRDIPSNAPRPCVDVGQTVRPFSWWNSTRTAATMAPMRQGHRLTRRRALTQSGRRGGAAPCQPRQRRSATTARWSEGWTPPIGSPASCTPSTSTCWSSRPGRKKMWSMRWSTIWGPASNGADG